MFIFGTGTFLAPFVTFVELLERDIGECVVSVPCDEVPCDPEPSVVTVLVLLPLGLNLFVVVPCLFVFRWEIAVLRSVLPKSLDDVSFLSL